ncbi:MAG: bifunctional methylenetetrahydrofolate dehydrogenase/methenyltetrahydrofolate cyclohydrolase FolD [Spirochaetia bacterium]|jgi:methylenetetrahydrofolate dehydrogenase (NADP+)/methenyltetrahydrofolate cyclohydrolase
MAARIINGTEIAGRIRGEIAEGIESLKRESGVTPGLAVVLVGDNPASRSYVRNKNKAAHEIGIYSEQHTLAGSASEAELLALVEKLNLDAKIHGILVQLPLPAQINETRVINAIAPHKDVDGFHPVSLGRIMTGERGFRPCTPLGIQKLLVYSGVKIPGSHVVVVGRSNIVGKPIANMLMQKEEDADATVTICHSHTRDLPSITRQADILIAAIGRPDFITADMVREGAVVIDVGINRIEDPTHPRGQRIVGDVKFDEVCGKAGAITPVPGGVGPMTIAMLLYNTLLSARAAVKKG